jgi:hypothetical protein
VTNRIDAGRGAGEVFRNHLALRLAGCTAEDIRTNYAEDVVLLCFDGAFRGRKAVRESAKRLASQLPNARFELTSEIVEGPYAFLLWRATADGCDAVDGADSFVIRGGRIVMQSVYYRLEPSARMPARFTPSPRASGERAPSAARRVRGL